MILTDTSVWIDHLRAGVPDLISALEAGDVLVHPLIMGELACGNISRRSVVLGLLRELPQSREATHAEVMAMVDARSLAGRGIGIIDAHLLASALLTPGTRLWTRDRRLDRVATELGIG